MDLDEDNSSYLSVTAISFLAITTALVALRTYVRARLTSNFQRDDWLMLVSQVTLSTESTLTQRYTNLTDRLHNIMYLYPARSQDRTWKTQQSTFTTR